jgi:SAM-dependent methyltransferase
MYTTIAPLLKNEILEIGSGLGNISAFAVREGLSITLSDIDPGYNQLLKEKFSSYPNVNDILCINLQQPGFAEHYVSLKEKFDTIFLLNVIEHLEDDRAAVENCRFMLKQGGNLIILAPAYPSLYCRFDKELGHYRRYTRKSLQAILSPSAFTILQNRYFNFPGIAGWFWFGKTLQRKMIGQGEMQVYDKLVPVFKIADALVFNKAGLSVIVTGRKK